VIDKSKRKDTDISILNVTNAAGFNVTDQIIVDNNVAAITEIVGNKITLDSAIKFPVSRNPIVRLVVQGVIDTDYNLSSPTDEVHVDDIRDFFIGMKIKVGNPTDGFESCVIESIDEDNNSIWADPTQKQPGTIGFDIYLAKPKQNGDFVRDCLLPNELINTYTLTSKDAWTRDGLTRDNVSKVLKKSVRVDSNAKGLSFFVGDLGLDDVEIGASIIFRPQQPLQDQYPARPDANCGAPFQCFCIGCDEDAFDEGIAALEALALTNKQKGGKKAAKK
jgi:hypothetical protein